MYLTRTYICARIHPIGQGTLVWQRRSCRRPVFLRDSLRRVPVRGRVVSASGRVREVGSRCYGGHSDRQEYGAHLSPSPSGEVSVPVGIPSPVSCLPSPVSCLLSPTFRLPPPRRPRPCEQRRLRTRDPPGRSQFLRNIIYLSLGWWDRPRPPRRLTLLCGLWGQEGVVKGSPSSPKPVTGETFVLLVRPFSTVGPRGRRGRRVETVSRVHGRSTPCVTGLTGIEDPR